MPPTAEQLCSPLDPDEPSDHSFLQWHFDIRPVVVETDLDLLVTWEPDYVPQTADPAVKYQYRSLLSSRGTQSFLCSINNEPLLSIDVYSPEMYKLPFNLPEQLSGYGIDFRFPHIEKTEFDKLRFCFSGFLAYLWTFAGVDTIIYRFDFNNDVALRLVLRNGFTYAGKIEVEPVMVPNDDGIPIMHHPPPFAFYEIVRTVSLDETLMP